MSERSNNPNYGNVDAINDASNKIYSAMTAHISIKENWPTFIKEVKAHYKVATSEEVFKILQNEFVNRLERHINEAGPSPAKEKVTKQQVMQLIAEAKQIEWHDPRQMGSFYKHVCTISKKPIEQTYYDRIMK